MFWKYGSFPFPFYLHADDTVNEKDETNEDGNPWQSLEGFDKCPKQSSDTLAFA